MKIEGDDCLRGHFNAVLPLLEQRVDTLVKYNHIKIGITCNYERRAKQHRTSRRHKWRKMHVLYQSSSHKNVTLAETALIEYIWGKYPLATKNKIGGGGGVNQPANHVRFYVYALVQPKRSNPVPADA